MLAIRALHAVNFTCLSACTIYTKPKLEFSTKHFIQFLLIDKLNLYAHIYILISCTIDDVNLANRCLSSNSIPEIAPWMTNFLRFGHRLTQPNLRRAHWYQFIQAPSQSHSPTEKTPVNHNETLHLLSTKKDGLAAGSKQQMFPNPQSHCCHQRTHSRVVAFSILMILISSGRTLAIWLWSCWYL